MNLLEKNHSEQEEQKEEEEKKQKEKEQKEKEQKEKEQKVKEGEQEWHEPKIPVILILTGIIIVLLICIVVLLFLSPNRKGGSAEDSREALQQDMLDYANEQKQNDMTAVPSQDTIVVETPELPAAEETLPEETVEESETENEEKEDEEEEDIIPESDTIDKTAIVVDIEDENDVSYTKEFIMNEMLPYFADNNLDAIWDLAHLKRYVKLSAGLKNTGTYYYQGGVDSDGKPDGVGLAIYENNTYYYGSWSHGLRSGDGRWIRFYIDEIGAKPTKKIYQSHSYSGMWSNDLPNGEGAEHYDVDISQLTSKDRIIQNVVGNFTNGLYDGDMYANTVDYRGNVEEWDGVAHQGVFDLWRDMSRIGECSVWKNRMDSELCLDIDKSENKNQGIRELFSTPAK